jgi:predicted RecA/RadA family phage recombinase
MQNYVQRGQTLTVTAPYALTSGGGCRVGNLFGVAVNTQASGDLSEIVTEGVFDLIKDGSTFASGDLVYWDDVAKKASSTVGSNLLIGHATLDQPSGVAAPGGLTGDATVRVRLFGVPGFSGQASGAKIGHFLYNGATDGYTSCTPANSDTIPANAVVFGGSIHSPTAVTASGAATVAIGTTAGSSATSILSAAGGAKANLTTDAIVPPTCTATPFKMSAAGQICITIASGPLLTGVIEGWILYATASEA